MKTADEMFEELGYKKKENSEVIFYYKLNGFDEECGFEFYKKEITPVCYNKKGELEAIYFTMEELQAINKKCEELGWI